MSRRTLRSVSYRVPGADRATARAILTAIPGFSIDYESSAEDAAGMVVLFCAKEYATDRATAQRADIHTAEAGLRGAGITFVNLGSTIEAHEHSPEARAVAVHKVSGQFYGRIRGRRHDEVQAQLQRIAELYGIGLDELDVRTMPD